MILVVNMVPNAESGETIQDSEPNVTVHPNDPDQNAGTAFTPDPFGGNAPDSASNCGRSRVERL